MKNENVAGRSGSPWIVFSVVGLSTFMATLDSSIVNVALPIITKTLSTNIHISQWVVTAYLLTISCLLPIFGRAGDMYGQRRVITLGITIFTFSSVLCGLSSTIFFLVLSRILQAVGASMMMSNGPAIIATTFPVRERGRALGAIGTVVALGSVTGPSLGGFLVGLLGWKSIFFINIPIGITAFVMGRIILPRSLHKDETFDFTGSILFALSIGSILLILSHGGNWGWLSSYSVAGFTIGIVSMILFVIVEKKAIHPMLELSLFKIRPFLLGNVSGLLSFIAMFSSIILLPFFLTGISGLSPSKVGLIITPFPLVMGITAPVSGYLSEKINPVYLTTAGLTVSAAGLLLMSGIDAETPIALIAMIQGLIGLGSGLFQSPNNNSVISSVPVNKTGTAGGVGALMRNVGMVTGTVLAVSIFENQRIGYLKDILTPTLAQKNEAFLHGFSNAVFTGAVVAIAGAIISMNRKGHIHPSEHR